MEGAKILNFKTKKAQIDEESIFKQEYVIV